MLTYDLINQSLKPWTESGSRWGGHVLLLRPEYPFPIDFQKFTEARHAQSLPKESILHVASAVLPES